MQATLWLSHDDGQLMTGRKKLNWVQLAIVLDTRQILGLLYPYMLST
jgi:hypothetical protein